MTVPIATVDTAPYCGACGWDTRLNLGEDLICDSCGSNLAASGLTAATTGTAGIPGTWDGVAPSTITGMTADPLTAWTTGQYVRDGEQNDWYWAGAIWTQGVAP